MKIVGIAGSLREGGNTEIAVREVLNKCKKRGADVELITLYHKRINDCTNCGVCSKGDCPIDDDVPKIIDSMKKADIIIIGTPVYFGDVSGVLKCLIDRCRIVKKQGMLFRNKMGGAIAVGSVWGQSRALETVAHFFCGHAMVLVSVDVQPGMGIQLTALEKGELDQLPNELKKLDKIAERIFELEKVCKSLSK